jgi:hypothetical protein
MMGWRVAVENRERLRPSALRIVGNHQSFPTS